MHIIGFKIHTCTDECRLLTSTQRFFFYCRHFLKLPVLDIIALRIRYQINDYIYN